MTPVENQSAPLGEFAGRKRRAHCGQSRYLLLKTKHRATSVRFPYRWVKQLPYYEKDKMSYFYKTTNSPIGILKLVASEKGLSAILWENDDPKRVRLSPLIEDKNHRVLLETERQLREYFEGQRQSFTVKLDPVGTKFQNKVWQALREIPFGQTRSYSEIAKDIGHTSAMRAVGAANGRNPLSIVVPCHRAIGASGHLTGFAGGLETKEFLLTLESTKDGPPRKWKPLQIKQTSQGPLSAMARTGKLSPPGL
jgi:methylated-DNA-[protein]-cysteine S-methyltransferase